MTYEHFEEDDTIWFIDAGLDEKTKEITEYAEKGTVVAIKKNGQLVVDFYAGLVVMEVEKCFKTKAECEKMIYIRKVAGETK